MGYMNSAEFMYNPQHLSCGCLVKFAAGYKNGHIGRLNIKQTANCMYKFESNLNSLKTQSVMAFNNLLVCAVLATAIYCATAAPTTIIYNLLSDRSGLFVEALANGDVRATASSTGKCMHAAV